MLGRSDGYVTASVSVLLFSFSVISVAFLSFVMNQSRLTTSTIERLDLDIALDNLFTETITELIEDNATQTVRQVQVESTQSTYTLSAEISDEAEKLDVLRAPLQDVEERVRQHIPSTEAQYAILRTIRSARNRIGNHASDFERLRNSSEVGRRDWRCFTRHFTFLQPPNNVRRRNRDISIEGSMFFVEMIAKHYEKEKRSLDAVILFTGRDEDPFWIYRWERYDAAEAGSCLND